jgi:hypothetical protein
MLPSSGSGWGRGRHLLLCRALALAALLALASASESDHKVRAHDPSPRPLRAADPSLCSHPSQLDRSSRSGSGPLHPSDLTLLGWWRLLLARGCSNVMFNWD